MKTKKTHGAMPVMNYKTFLGAVLIAILSFGLTAHGQTATWQGDVNTSWGTVGNWTNDAPPNPGDIAIFDHTAAGTTCDLGGFFQFFSELHLSGQSFTFTNGILRPGAASNQVYASGTGLTHVIEADVTAPGVQYDIFVESGAALVFNGVASGPRSFVKSGPGTLTLGGLNTYSVGTVIRDGTLRVADDANLGFAGTGVTFEGGTLDCVPPINLARPLISTLTSDVRLRNDLFQFFDLSGASISGPGGLVKSGSGAVSLTGSANTYSGPTVIEAGFLDLGGSGELIPDGSDVTVNGFLRLYQGVKESIGGLSGAGTVTFNNPGAQLVVGGANATAQFSGMVLGDGSLVKVGTGIQTLSNGGT
ncbi:MAG: autotransporter-associated beta strand repeat-containing protein, partial [Verrucomicrobiota bacterium]